MRDLACALARFDYETIADAAENTKSEKAMNEMLERFEYLILKLKVLLKKVMKSVSN